MALRQKLSNGCDDVRVIANELEPEAAKLEDFFVCFTKLGIFVLKLLERLNRPLFKGSKILIFCCLFILLA